MKEKETSLTVKLSNRIIFFLIHCFCAALTIAGQDSQVFDDPPFWRQALGGAVIGPPASQAESVVMVSDGGNIKALSWQGKTLWDYFARGRLQPYITRSREGTSYVCRSSGRTGGILIAVNRSGRELWQVNLGEPMTAPVITGWDGRLFVFTVNHIRCFTASGFPLWSKPLEKGIAMTPRADGAGGFCLVLEDGELLWTNAFGLSASEKLPLVPLTVIPVALGAAELSANAGQPATDSKNGNSLLIVYPSGTLELYHTVDNSREVLKGISLSSRPMAAAVRHDRAAILMENSRICLVSLTEQKALWTGESHLTAADFSGSAKPDSPFPSSILYDERGIYLLTNNGASAFAEDGRRLWIIRLRGAAALPAFSDEGILYSGGADWILYAYKLEERVRVQKRLLYGPAPEGSYGTGVKRPERWADYINLFYEDEMGRWFTEIEQAVRQGQIGENEKLYVSWLMEIAGSALGIVQPGTRPPVFVQSRVRAVRLLSYMGSMETVPFLADLFTREKDMSVKAAAAEALGRIGVDPEGIALEAFSNAVFPPAPLRDEQVLASITTATGAICRFSGPPLSEAGVRILTALAAAERPPVIRGRAEQEILSLRL